MEPSEIINGTVIHRFSTQTFQLQRHFAESSGR
jgi:hypothetical protein